MKVDFSAAWLSLTMFVSASKFGMLHKSESSLYCVSSVDALFYLATVVDYCCAYLGKIASLSAC